MKSLWSIALVALIFSGCSTNKRYYEPASTLGSLHYQNKLPARIIDANAQGATLANGQILSYESGYENITIDKGFLFLNKNDGRYLATNDVGVLKIYDGSGKVVYSKDFGNLIISASIQNNTLAMIFSNDLLVLFDVATDKIISTFKADLAQVNSAKSTAPVYLGSFVIFPTLDGRLVVIDQNTKRVVRDVVISSKPKFNNVIFLKLLGNKIIAATPYKVIAITPDSVNKLEVDIKDVHIVDNNIYVLSRDGRVILANDSLKIIQQKKFPYAMFLGAISGKVVYVIEQNGHVIALDKNLLSSNVYNLPDNIEDYIFTNKDTFYYGNQYFKLDGK